MLDMNITNKYMKKSKNDRYNCKSYMKIKNEVSTNT